jgi:hypothetical protein
MPLVQVQPVEIHPLEKLPHQLLDFCFCTAKRTNNDMIPVTMLKAEAKRLRLNWTPKLHAAYYRVIIT